MEIQVSESEVLTACLKHLGNRDGMRIWRQNTGNSRGIVERFARELKAMLPDYCRPIIDRCVRAHRPIAFGIPGQSDVGGARRPNGQILAVETKSETGRQSTEQKNYQRMIESLGGLYILARDVSDLYSEFPKL